jgi:hypothetical protein
MTINLWSPNFGNLDDVYILFTLPSFVGARSSFSRAISSNSLKHFTVSFQEVSLLQPLMS